VADDLPEFEDEQEESIAITETVPKT